MNARWMNYQKLFRHGKNIPINQTTEAVKKKCEAPKQHAHGVRNWVI